MSSVIASPATRAYAGRQGVDINALGVEIGRESIAREDIDRKLAGGQADAKAANGYADYWKVDHGAHGAVDEQPTSRFAQVSAANMAAAHAMIPAVTHHDRAEISQVEEFRQSLRAEAAERGTRLTALSFHVKALARTLGAFPRFNASLSPDGKSLILKQYVHIGIAVDTAHGLVVPVIRDANRKGLWRISKEISDLAERAQARRICPDEMGGASMTISNLGGIGGTAFTPIVNPPEVAILGITRTETVPVWDGDCFKPVRMAPLDLSYDHRVINGADAARFVTHYARLLADPRRMFV